LRDGQGDDGVQAGVESAHLEHTGHVGEPPQQSGTPFGVQPSLPGDVPAQSAVQDVPGDGVLQQTGDGRPVSARTDLQAVTTAGEAMT
jgi:hypothetical protein